LVIFNSFNVVTSLDLVGWAAPLFFGISCKNSPAFLSALSFLKKSLREKRKEEKALML